ncbi:MAG: ABC transporter substrate-binding protein [Nitrospira sp.]|nr:ABC transporter substrate-binding protein [Nitrospira sp.]
MRWIFPRHHIQRVPQSPVSRWISLLMLMLLTGSIGIACAESPPEVVSTTSKPQVTLHFVSWKPDHARVWEDALARFTASHPHISVVRELAPHSSTAYHDLLTQKLKNGDTSVDVFFMDVIWVPEFAAARWARPLDDKFLPAMQQAFLPATTEVGRYEQHLYGVPSRIDAGLLYYRKDLLAKYGFDAPTTWEELIRQAETILTAERTVSPTLQGYVAQFKQYEGLVCNMLEVIEAHGGSLLTADGSRSALSTAPALDAIAFVRNRLIGRITSRAALTYQEPESLSLFLQGQAIFHRNWPYAWELANNPARSIVAGRVGVAPLPGTISGRHAAALGGWLYGISASSQHPEEAWALIEFLSGEAMQKRFAQEAGIAPSRTALFSDPDLLAASPQLRNHLAILQAATPRPRSPIYPALSHLLQRYFSRALAVHDLDLRQEAAITDAHINRLLALTRLSQ